MITWGMSDEVQHGRTVQISSLPAGSMISSFSMALPVMTRPQACHGLGKIRSDTSSTWLARIDMSLVLCHFSEPLASSL